MLKALESKFDIAAAQQKFQEAFNPYVEDSFSVDIGYQGGYAHRTVIWMPALDLWAHFGFPPSEKGRANRYWNVLGIGKPSGMVSIACEINPPIKARKYPPAGVFAKGGDSLLVVLHRGRLTITRGITFEFVRRHYRGKWVNFYDRGVRKEAIKVAEIPSDRFGYDVRDFVVGILRVKEMARSSPVM